MISVRIVKTSFSLSLTGYQLEKDTPVPGTGTGQITRTRTRLHGKPIKLKIHRVTPGTMWAKMLRKRLGSSKENFSTFVPKTLQIRKTSVYVRMWIHSGLISKDKDHKNLPVSPFSPGANIRVDHRLPRENVLLLREGHDHVVI